MSGGRIFLVGNSEDALTEMVETEYAKEDILQSLLTRYPDLLPGDQIAPEAPRRWLLVAREMGVPDGLAASDRWSVDHLYLDQDGTPTFVECKRSSDTRIRREVVAQMLDYAANGPIYWGPDRLRQTAAETSQRRGRMIDDDVRALIGSDADIEQFWKKVEGNLQSGKVRLIFVADVIPTELRRLVEFLNDKMDDLEVLAVEIKQFLGRGDQRVVVPRLIGMTEAAREKKALTSGKTNQTTFLQACPPEAASIFEMVLAYARERGHIVYWGQVCFSVRPVIGGKVTTVLYGWPSTSPPVRLEFYTGSLNPQRLPAVRSQLDAMGIFSLGGEHTYRAPITSESAERIREAFGQLARLIDGLARQG